MSHNAEVQLCNLYQVAEAFNGIASCKIFAHLSCSIILLHLIDDLFARTQISFCRLLVKQFSFINRNVSLKQILFTWFNISHSIVYKRRNLVKTLKFNK